VRPAPLARPLVAALALLTVTACSSGLPVSPPDPLPTGAAAYACSTLHGRLPDEVSGQTVTATEPQSPLTSAWGTPSIVLRCGVGVPAALTPTSQLLTVDGVDWLPEKLTAGYLFTTVGRAVNVEVSVPSAYTPEADALADLSPAVAAAIPASG
jgi:hypothetical protein